MVAERVEPTSTMYVGRMDTREEWLPVNALVIPDEYQRHYNPSWAKKIGRDFRMERLTKISVNRRPDGTLAIIDGQHRIGGIRYKFGENTDLRVVCDVYSLATVQEEADLFLAMNHFVRPTDTRATFKALLASNDPTAVELQQLARSYGYELSVNSSWANGFLPVAPLLDLRRRHDRQSWGTISHLLGVLREVYGDDTGNMKSALVSAIGGFIAMYRDHPDYQRDRLLQVLRREGQDAIVRKARDLTVILSTTNTTGGRKAVLALYNNNLRNRRLPDV